MECRSAEVWKAINLSCGRKFRFTNCVNAESIDDMKLMIENHYAAVLIKLPVIIWYEFFSESSPLTNKYDYSFTIPEIRTALRTSRSNTASGSDGIPTRVLQLCELESINQSIKFISRSTCTKMNKKYILHKLTGKRWKLKLATYKHFPFVQ